MPLSRPLPTPFIVMALYSYGLAQLCPSVDLFLPRWHIYVGHLYNGAEGHNYIGHNHTGHAYIGHDHVPGGAAPLRRCGRPLLLPR